MKKQLFILLAASLLVCTATTGFSKSTPQIQWYKDIDKAFAAAKSEDKLIMVDVYTDWCGWCTELDDKTYSNKKVRKYAENFISLKVNPENSEQENELAVKYQVSGYPDILFLDKEGTLVHRVSGFMKPKPFLQEMAKAAETAARLASLVEEYERGNMESGAELLDIHLNNGNFESAIPLITELDSMGLLPDEKKAVAYNAIGYSYVQNEDYKAALSMFRKNIKGFTAGDFLYEHNFAAYYIGYSLFMLSQKIEAADYLIEYMDKNEMDQSLVPYFNQLLTDITS